MAMVDSPQAAMALTVTARSPGGRTAPRWLVEARRKIGARLDLLLYLDLTMSPLAQRLAMSRLAPVQPQATATQ